MTHFSNSEAEYTAVTQRQQQRFADATQDISIPTSLANSAAIIQHPDSHADWVRPGIMLYGANPLSATHPLTDSVSLIPAMTLCAPVIAVRDVAKGESVGYNQRWQAKETSKIATVAIGYGDGYPRHAKNGTPVWVNGEHAKLAGTVSMDLITIDITDCAPVAVGDTVELWGEHVSVSTVAEHSETISYELLTAVSKRVPRRYCG